MRELNTFKFEKCLKLHTCTYSGMSQSGKNQGKTIIFQGQGKVREFCKRSGKIFEVAKVSEKSGNFIFLVHKVP